MNRRAELGVAVVGCGHWGGNYLRLLHALGVGRVVACDVDGKRLEQLARQYPGLVPEPSASRAVADQGVQAVIVATTASSHHALAREALLAGRDVLVEKPLTLRSEDARALVDLAGERGRLLMVGHTFLYNPAVRWLKDFIARGEAGSLYYLQATRTHLGLVRRDVNAVWDLGAHDVSIFNYLLGALPESVSASGGRFLSREKEDAAFITLRYPGGVLAHCFVSWVDTNKTRQVAIIGSRARALFDDLNNLERIKVFEKGLSLDRPYSDFGEFQLLVRDGDIWSPRVDATEPLRVMVEHFLERVLEGREPLTSGRSGLEVVEILEAIDRSMARGGAPVELPWPRA